MCGKISFGWIYVYFLQRSGIVGYGKPATETMSFLVILIISIGLGLPIAIIVFGGTYLQIRKRCCKSNRGTSYAQINWSDNNSLYFWKFCNKAVFIWDNAWISFNIFVVASNMIWNMFSITLLNHEIERVREILWNSNVAKIVVCHWQYNIFASIHLNTHCEFCKYIILIL